MVNTNKTIAKMSLFHDNMKQTYDENDVFWKCHCPFSTHYRSFSTLLVKRQIAPPPKSFAADSHRLAPSPPPPPPYPPLLSETLKVRASALVPVRLRPRERANQRERMKVAADIGHVALGQSH